MSKKHFFIKIAISAFFLAGICCFICCISVWLPSLSLAPYSETHTLSMDETTLAQHEYNIKLARNLQAVLEGAQVPKKDEDSSLLFAVPRRSTPFFHDAKETDAIEEDLETPLILKGVIVGQTGRFSLLDEEGGEKGLLVKEGDVLYDGKVKVIHISLDVMNLEIEQKCTQKLKIGGTSNE